MLTNVNFRKSELNIVADALKNIYINKQKMSKISNFLPVQNNVFKKYLDEYFHTNNFYEQIATILESRQKLRIQIQNIEKKMSKTRKLNNKKNLSNQHKKLEEQKLELGLQYEELVDTSNRNTDIANSGNSHPLFSKPLYVLLCLIESQNY